MIENSLEKLSGEFKIKSKVLMEVSGILGFKIFPFETRRSRARQAWLYANKKPGQAVGKPGTSYHEKGKAVDRVFAKEVKVKRNGKIVTETQPTWEGKYPSIHFIGFMCGVTPLYKNRKLVESCHLQDDGKSIVAVMKNNSARYQKETKKNQDMLALVNATFRKYLYK